MNETNELTMNVRIKECFDSLYLRKRDLTAGQLNFIESCKKQFKREKILSDRQLTILEEIKKYLPQQDGRMIQAGDPRLFKLTDEKQT